MSVQRQLQLKEDSLDCIRPMSAPGNSHIPVPTMLAAMDSNHGSQPAVELGQMPQQIEVRCAEDDWTGRNSAAERRKLQNRLNQRIYRRRRGAKPKVVQPKAGASPTTFMAPQQPLFAGKFNGLLAAVGPIDEIQVEEGGSGSASSATTYSPGVAGQKKWVAGRTSRCLGRAHLEVAMARFEDLARQDYMLGSPRVDQLLTLIQFNVFRALIRNTLTMGWTLEWLECTDPISPWNGLPQDNEPPCPQSLRPTHVQRTIKHHPWIDLWPIPKMRDNLLLAGDSYDEDQLCNDLVEFEDITNEQTGLIVWGEPWDPNGWEVSETFLRNWGWTVKGCIELLQSTNYWRARRGEKPLVCELYGLDMGTR